MTEQIVIKLNKERFEPILKALEEKGHSVPKSYSELVGWCLWYVYYTTMIEAPEFGGKPLVNHILEHRKITMEQGLIRVIQTYNIMMKEGLDAARHFILESFSDAE